MDEMEGKKASVTSDGKQKSLWVIRGLIFFLRLIQPLDSVSLFGKTFRDEAVDQTVRDFGQNGQEEPVSVQLECEKNIPKYPNGLTEDPHSVLLLPLFHAGTNSMCHIHSPPCVISHAAWWCGHLP